MTRRRLFGLSLAPLFAPLLAWLPGRREEVGPVLVAELPAEMSWDGLGYVIDTSSLPVLVDGAYHYVFDEIEQPPVMLVYRA